MEVVFYESVVRCYNRLDYCHKHSPNSISHGRHLSGKRREATAEQLEFSDPSNLHYSLFTHSQNVFIVAEKGNKLFTFDRCH